MANLLEDAIWEEEIYQLEKIDKIKGGPGGIANLQAQQLANRTLYLKQSLAANFAEHVDLQNSLNNVFNGLLLALDRIKELEDYALEGGGFDHPDLPPRPAVIAGGNHIIRLPVTSVTLAGSIEAEHNFVTSTLWKFVSGPGSPVIVNPELLSTQVTGLEVGGYVFRLTATDYFNRTVSATVEVTVNYGLVSVNAAPVQPIAPPASSAALSGAASSPNGAIVSYLWEIVSGPGDPVIADPESASTDVTGLEPGNYVFRLSAEDSAGETGHADVAVAVYGVVTVNAGSGQSLDATSVTLSGSASSPNGTIVTYQWARVSGPNTPTIVTPNAATTQVTGLQVGVYVFHLTATDSVGQSASASTTVTARGLVRLTPGPTGLSVGRYTLKGASVGNYAVFAGGTAPSLSAAVDAYNTSLTRTTPSALSVARASLSGASVGNYAVFAGGTAASRSAVVDAYNASLTRTTATALSQARGLLAGASVGGHAIFAGGDTGISFEFSANVDAYNTSLTRSTPTVLSKARWFWPESGGGSIGNYAIFAGGVEKANSGAIVDAYNSSLTRSTPTALSNSGNAVLANTSDHILAAMQSTVNAYNTSLTRSIPTALSQARNSFAGASVGGHAIFAGGRFNSLILQVETYNASLTRSTTTNISKGRARLTGASVGAYAFFAGGSEQDPGGSVYDTVDVYYEVS